MLGAGKVPRLEGSAPNVGSVSLGVETVPCLERDAWSMVCLLYTSPSPRDGLLSRMPSSA